MRTSGRWRRCGGNIKGYERLKAYDRGWGEHWQEVIPGIMVMTYSQADGSSRGSCFLNVESVEAYEARSKENFFGCKYFYLFDPEDGNCAPQRSGGCWYYNRGEGDFHPLTKRKKKAAA